MYILDFDDIKVVPASDVKDRLNGNSFYRLGLRFYADGKRDETFQKIKDGILLRLEDYILRALSGNTIDYEPGYFKQVMPYATKKRGMTHVWSDSENELLAMRYTMILANNRTMQVELHDGIRTRTVTVPWRKGAVAYTKGVPFEFVYEDITDDDIYEFCKSSNPLYTKREGPCVFVSYKDGESMIYGGYVKGGIMLNHENIYMAK